MTYAHTRRILATIVAALCIAVPVSASASDGLASSDRTDAAQSGSSASLASTLAIAKSTFPAADFRGGDTPVDHPGVSRAPTSAPTTIEIVRPVRTVVRDVNQALPLILSSSALLLVLIALGIALVRIGMVPRIGHSR